MIDYPYVWRWRRVQVLNTGEYRLHPFADRVGTRCRVLARGRLNSAAIEFESDGHRAIVSRNAFRKSAAWLPTEPPTPVPTTGASHRTSRCARARTATQPHKRDGSGTPATPTRRTPVFDQPDPVDPVVAAAQSAVALARHRLREVRRRFIRREAGATDVVKAEAQLAAALAHLDDVHGGTGWRT